jgi:hypothetical protein
MKALAAVATTLLLLASSFELEGAQSADARDFFLVRARIASIGEALPVTETDLSTLSARFKMHVDRIESFIGTLNTTSGEVEMRVGGLPVAGVAEVFILGRRDIDGTLRAIQWNYADDGFCLAHDLARTYQLEDTIRMVRQSARFKWHPNCDW